MGAASLNSIIEYPSVADGLNEEKRLLQQVTEGNLDQACISWSANLSLVVPLKVRHHEQFTKACQVSAD